MNCTLPRLTLAFVFLIFVVSGQSQGINKIVELGVIAGIAEEAGEFRVAIAAHKEILKHDPSNLMATHYIAGLYGKLFEYDQETIFAEKAIAIDPEYMPAYINLANGQLYKRQVREAISTLKTAIQLEPDNPLPYYTFGLVLEAMKDLNGAKVQYQKAIEVDPTFESGYFNLATVYANLDEMDDAKATLKKLIALNPNDLETRGFYQELLRDETQETSSVPTQSEPYISIRQLSPEPNSKISKDVMIKAQIEYDINNPEPNQLEYAISVKFETPKIVNGRHTTFSSGNLGHVAIQDQAGSVSIEYPMSKIWESPKLKKPVTVYFYLHKINSATSSTVIAATEAIYFSE